MGISAVDLKKFCLILNAKEKSIEYPFTHINVIIDFFKKHKIYNPYQFFFQILHVLMHITNTLQHYIAKTAIKIKINACISNLILVLPLVYILFFLSSLSSHGFDDKHFPRYDRCLEYHRRN